MYAFAIRPSESTATDIAGLMTLLTGFSRNFVVNYENTVDALYNISIKGKIVCVTATLKYTTTDCASSIHNETSTLKLENVTKFNIKMEKNEANPVLKVTLIEKVM